MRQHIPALDGLRALSAIAVVAGHALLPLRGFGYGVDVFFVLSGSLITGLLLDEVDRSGRIDRRAFYIRRAARLLPALRCRRRRFSRGCHWCRSSHRSGRQPADALLLRACLDNRLPP